MERIHMLSYVVRHGYQDPLTPVYLHDCIFITGVILAS